MFLTVSLTAAKPSGGENDHLPPTTAKIKNESNHSQFGSFE